MKGVYKLSDELKQEAKDYRESLYQMEPQVKSFSQLRKALVLALMALLVLHEILNGVLIGMGLEDASYMTANIIRLFLHLAILLLVRAAGGKGALALLIIAAPSTVTLVQSMPYAPFVFGALSPSPLLGVLFSVEVVYTLLVWGVLVWQILPPSLRLANREREIFLAYSKFVNDRIPPEFRS